MSLTRWFLPVSAFVAGALAMALILDPALRAHLLPAAAVADADLYAPRDWTDSTPSKLNISSFAFDDRDRSGSYTHGDRPMAGVALRLTRPDGSTRIGRSNINGFINFPMQLVGDEGVITETGKPYRFELIAPPGWEITTANAVHATAFREVPGSIAGMGAEDPPPVVGLAALPVLRGHWPDAAGETLLAEAADGTRQSVTIDAAGHFEQLLSPGPWTIRGAAQGDGTRQVTLGFAPVVLGQGSGGQAGPGDAQRVDFDDIRRSDIEKLAPGYAGLGWDYLLAVNNQFYKGPGYVNTLVSGSKVAYNSSGHPVTLFAIEPGGRFDFIGGYFGTAWPQAEGEVLIARAYRGEELVAEDSFALSHLGPVYFQADYLDISRLELTTAHYWQFVVDDLAIRAR
jgi:hypothetical protein